MWKTAVPAYRLPAPALCRAEHVEPLSSSGTVRMLTCSLSRCRKRVRAQHCCDGLVRCPLGQDWEKESGWV